MKQRKSRLILYRLLVAFAAACFVSAFAIAALAPLGLTLAGGLLLLDETTLSSLRRIVVHDASNGMWSGVVVPFLVRPAWILPVMLGVISTGLAMTVSRPAGPSAGARKRR
ncbi:hypothetical protein [Lichenicola sp.]|uniref:hypothetical protein n=1 Tax=Lichenicola sp. TaxID=2804529 RepID=UPI003B0083F7